MEYRRTNVDMESMSEESSDDFSDSNLITQKDTFSIEEPAENKKIWYQWLKYRLKYYMILEGVFFILLVLLLLNSYKSSAKNEKILELINDIEVRVLSMKKQMENLEIAEMNPKPITKERVEPELSEKQKEEPQTFKSIFGTAASKSSTPNHNADPRVESKLSKEQKMLEPQTIKSIFEASPIAVSYPFPLFNAADFLLGATVDSSESSHSTLSPFLTWDQTGNVILDRLEPPPTKAWCSSERNPVLTVNLAKYVKPIAVSYQHSKWNKSIPSGAPKKYIVSACLDYNCEDVQLLASNCEYKETDQQEQLCRIPLHKNFNSIIKVQFQFHENYGHVKETCVNLVRVYGETEYAPKAREQRVEDAEDCSTLTHRFHHNSLAYTLSEKNCTILYSKQCCEECPECCAQCDIQDFNIKTVVVVVLLFPFIFVLITALLASMGACCSNNRR